MGTMTYFEGTIKDVTEKGEMLIEAGTTGFAGKGPQMYLKVDGNTVILSDEDAVKMCNGIAGIARYLGLTTDY